MSERNGIFGSELTKTDVSNLAPGVYTIQLKTETGIANRKFMVN